MALPSTGARILGCATKEEQKKAVDFVKFGYREDFCNMLLLLAKKHNISIEGYNPEDTFAEIKAEMRRYEGWQANNLRFGLLLS